MTEHDVQNQILDFLRYSGHYAQRINSGSSFGINNGKTWRIKNCDAGTPDIFACVHGNFVAFEVKKDQKTVDTWKRKVESYKKTSVLSNYSMREIQQYKSMCQIEKAGGLAFVVSSVDEVKAVCDKLKSHGIDHVVGEGV